MEQITGREKERGQEGATAQVQAKVLKKESEVKVLVTQSCGSLYNPMTAALQAPLSMGILQARILELFVMPFSKGSSQPRDRTQLSHISDGFFTI